MQKRYKIYNRALSMLNRDPKSEAEWEADTDSKERILCDIWYEQAIDNVRSERPWSFLQEELFLGEDEGRRAGFEHSYPLPCDMFRLCSVLYKDGVEDENHLSQYRIVSGYLLSEKPVDCAYGMLQELPCEGIPEGFFVLSSFALAILMATGMGFDEKSTAIIERQYYEHLSKLMFEDARFNRRDRIS